MTPRRTRLNQKAVEAARPEDREFVLWDEALSGFGVRIRPSGHKTYIVKCRVKGVSAIQRKASIGSHPAVTCATAKDRAQTLLAEARLGIGAPGQPASDDAEITLSGFWTQYDRDHVGKHMKSSSAAEARRLARLILLPRLGACPLREIDVSRVRTLHGDLRETPAQANRVLALLSAILNRAMQWEVIPPRTNPCGLVAKYKEIPRERFLTARETRRLADTLSQSEGQNPVFTNAIRLILYTGMRKGEALSLRWTEVDLDHARLNLSDSKTGKKSISLNALALDLLRDLSESSRNNEGTTSLYVFPRCDSVTGDRSSHAVGLQKFWERVRHDAELDDVRLHDLRHSFASFAAESGISLTMIGDLLGHKDVRSTARYAHLSDHAQRHAADETGKTICHALAASRAHDTCEAA